MIKYTHKNGMIDLELKGEIDEICADVHMLILEIYGRKLEKNPKDAETFKHCIKQGVEDGICFEKGIAIGMSEFETLMWASLLFAPLSFRKDKNDIEFEKFSKKFSEFMKGDKTEEE